MTTIQIRVDDETKKSAKAILDVLGIDMSMAIKAYLRQLIIHKGIPFPLRTENNLTPMEEKEILKASNEARGGRNVSRSMSTKESIEYLNKL